MLLLVNSALLFKRRMACFAILFEFEWADSVTMSVWFTMVLTRLQVFIGCKVVDVKSVVCHDST